MNSYEEKKQERIDRLRDRATAARKESGELFSRARELGSVIPFGQPILVGHHSEKADRNYRARIDRTYERSFEASDKAEHYERKAEAAASNRAISSDDPEAVQKLKAKIEKLEKLQSAMKECNKVVRLKGLTDAERVEKMAAIVGPSFVEKHGEGRLYKILEADFAGRVGFADYQLTNNGANIRRLRQRLERLERSAAGADVKSPEHWEDLKKQKGATTEVEVVENTEEKRIQLVFQGKPAAEIRATLKRFGFRWSPSNMAWQRHLNNAGRFAAENVLAYLT